MEIILFAKQVEGFLARLVRDEPWGGKGLVEVGENVVALDVDGAIVHQDRNESARVDAEKPGGVVLLRAEIDGVGNPVDALQI